jgi:hypothetical protein
MSTHPPPIIHNQENFSKPANIDARASVSVEKKKLFTPHHHLPTDFHHHNKKKFARPTSTHAAVDVSVEKKKKSRRTVFFGCRQKKEAQ